MDTAERQELLKKEILDSAEKNAETMVQRAERDREKARREAEEKAAALKEEALHRAEAEAEQQAGRVMASIPLDRVRLKLAAQEAVVQQAVSAAVQRIVDQQSPERAALMASLLADAVVAIGEAEVIVDAAERDRPLLQDVFRRAETILAARGSKVQFHAGSDTPDISAGVIVRSRDGHKLVDHSIEARRRRLEPQMRIEIAEILFRQSGQEEKTESQNHRV